MLRAMATDIQVGVTTATTLRSDGHDYIHLGV